MNLKDILAISGEGTLFKFIAQGKNAVIVENLETGRRFTAGATAKVSALEEISVFTTGEDMSLGKVMDKIWEKENGGETISHRLPDADLRKYFSEALPEYDHDRVYTSDIKKVLHWYNILHKLNLLVREEEKEEVKEGEKEKVLEKEKEGEKERKKETEKAEPKGKKAVAPAKQEPASPKTSVRKKPAKEK